MIDVHSHILSETDDGALDFNMTLEMLEIAKASGTNAIFATPHYHRGRFEVDYKEIKKRCEALMGKLEGFEIYPGQEVFIDKYTLDDLEGGLIGTLNGTRYMLIELAFDQLKEAIFDILYELKLKGITPILAHPERYRYIVENPIIINRFIEEGILFQLNSNSLEGVFGKEVKHTAEILLEHGICDFLGSDAHNTGKRNASLKNGLEIMKMKNNSIIEKLEKNSKLLLKNEIIISNALKIKQPKNFLNLFKRK